MSQEVVQQLLTGALKAIRNGEKDLARRAYIRVLKLEPDNEMAYIGLATTARDRQEQLLVLKKLLEIKPDSQKARAALAQLGLNIDSIQSPSAAKPDAAPASPPTEDVYAGQPYDEAYDDEAVTSEPYLPQDNYDWGMTDAEYTAGSDIDDFDDDAIDDGAVYDRYDDVDDDRYGNVYDDVYAASQADEADYDEEADLNEGPYEDTYDTADTMGLYDALFDEDNGNGDYDDAAPQVPGTAYEAYEVEEDGLFDDEDALPTETEADLPVTAPEPVITLVPLDLSEVFSEAFIQLPGRDGIPIMGQEAIVAASQQAEQIVQNEQETFQQRPQIEWAAKQGRRSGENDWFIFRMQVAAVSGVALFVVGLIVLLILNAPGAPLSVARAIRFTQTPTPTATATPGITHTPSPTPRETLTPEPTLPSNFPLGNPTIAPPPTEIYMPPGVGMLREVQEALPLIENGQIDQAISLLDRAQQTTNATGNFLPYYYLSIAMLADDRPDDAREIIEDGEENWQERGINVNAHPLINVAYARVDLYEVENRSGGEELLQSAEDRLLDVINGADGDGRFVDAYLLLAERYLISGEEDAALRALDQAYRDTLRGDLLGDSRIRLMRADIYAEQDRYAAALYELETLLRADNFIEEAHQRRIEIAMASGQIGLAVKYAEAYAFYFPGKIEPYLLWGDAHLAEGKVDWALQYYSRGLQGNPSDPAYLETLLKRASLYVQQGDYDLAFADYDEALAISDDNPDVRLQRMVAAYTSGNIDVAETDLEALSGDDVELSGDSLLIQGRILLDTGQDPQIALNLIERAVNVRGVDSTLRPIADEYRARAFLELERYNDALAAVERLGNIESNIDLRALRGRIYEALGRQTGDQDDLENALKDYEFVMSWQQILPTGDVNLEAISESYETLVAQLR